MKFGEHAVEPATRTLWRGTRKVDLQQQPMELLLLLVEQADTVVTRDTIRERIWPDVVVDYDANINYAIRQIRVALGSDADRIQTVPRRGYRFVGPVGTPRRYTPPTISLVAALATAFAVVFGAGLVAARTESGAFVSEHIVHPARCPYVRMLLPSFRNS